MSEQIDLEQRYYEAMNRLAKWRTVFASWQLGTRLAMGDGELAAVKNHHEATLFQCVELDAFVQLLIRGSTMKGEWQFAERQTPGPDDSEASAVKAHREETLRLRVELNALTSLLIAKGILTLEEFQLQCIEETEHKHRALEHMFPGARATDAGIAMSFPEWRDTVRKYSFPP